MGVTLAAMAIRARIAYSQRILTASATPQPHQQRIIGRYAIYDEVASGGMATVHIGRLLGEAGFSRTVAIKRLHEQFSKDPDFVAMFIDEARLASRIRHPNVVSTLDVVTLGSEIFLVMDFVQGEALSRLIRSMKASRSRVPTKIALSIMVGALHGLNAAHDAKSENGQLLGIVHRDVSPQNILVDVDGVGRVIDFGVAKAAGRLQSTRDGTLKGKLQYMPPEQIEGGTVDRRSDVYAASVVLWELLTARRLFQAENEVSLLKQILETTSSGSIEPPSKYVSGLPRALDSIVAKGLSAKPDNRFPTARDMAVEIEKALVLASNREVGDWLEQISGENLKKRAERIAEIESISTITGVTAVHSAHGSTAQVAFTSSSTDADGAPPSISASRAMRPAAGVPADASARESTPVSRSMPGVHPLSVPADVGPIPESKPRSGGIVLAAVALGGTFAIAVLLIGFFLFRPVPSAQQQPLLVSDIPVEKPGSASPTAASASALSPPTGSVGDLSVGSPPPSDPVVPLASADPIETPPPGTKTAATRTATTLKTPPSTGTSKRPPGGCDPPYTIGADGIKRFKPECVR